MIDTDQRHTRRTLFAGAAAATAAGAAAAAAGTGLLDSPAATVAALTTPTTGAAPADPPPRAVNSRYSGAVFVTADGSDRNSGASWDAGLATIAHALEVPLTSLLQIESRSSPVVQADKRRPLAPHFFESDEVRSELLTPDLDRQLQVCRYVLPPGSTTESTPFVHHGEEFITVLKGQCTVGLDDAVYELGPGDSIAYAATTPHWFGNRGTRKTELLFACTPPTF